MNSPLPVATWPTTLSRNDKRVAADFRADCNLGADLARPPQPAFRPADLPHSFYRGDLRRGRLGFAPLGQGARIWITKVLFNRRSHYFREHAISVISVCGISGREVN